jgi:hypothetical protein
MVLEEESRPRPDPPPRLRVSPIGRKMSSVIIRSIPATFLYSFAGDLGVLLEAASASPVEKPLIGAVKADPRLGTSVERLTAGRIKHAVK